MIKIGQMADLAKAGFTGFLGALPSLTVVGLDIGSSSVKAVKLHRSPSGITAISVATAAVPQPIGRMKDNLANRAAAVRKTVMEGKLKNQRIAAVLASANIVERALRMPDIPGSELRKALLWEVQKYVPFDPEDICLDYMVLEEIRQQGANQLVVYAVAASLIEISRQVDFFRSLDLIPVAFETKATALSRAYAAAGLLPPDKTAAIIDIGAGSIVIAIVKKELLYFVRVIPWGGDRFTETIAAAQGIDWVQAEEQKINGEFKEEDVGLELENIQNEVQRSFDYYMAQYLEEKVDAAFITGGGSRLKGLTEYLNKALEIEISNKEPYQKIKWPAPVVDAGIDTIGSRLSLAIGLSDQ